MKQRKKTKTLKSELVKKEFNIIEKKYGTLRAEDALCEVETSPSSYPNISSKLCWDDSVAGRLYRLDQIRNMIRVTVEYLPAPKNNVGYVKVRAFHSLTPNRRLKGGGYTPTVKIMSDKDKYEQLCVDALNDLRSMQVKYSSIIELSSIFEKAIAVLEKKVK